MFRVCCLLITCSQIFSTPVQAMTENLSDTLELTDQFIIPVTINGQSFRWEVSPEGGAARIVNADVAKALALKPSMIAGIHMIGPIRLNFSSDSAQINYADIVRKDRLFWYDRKASDVYDGVIHPNMLPYSKVRFILSPKAPEERETVLPLEGSGMLGIGGGVGKFLYGDVEVRVSFNLKRQETLMTAPAGVVFAGGQGGAFAEQQRQALIRFGVERPVRLIRFSRPVLLFDRPLTSALVRVSDFGDASTIVDESAVDLDEIVVTGKTNKKARYSVILGRDFLTGCSSLTYDMKAKLIRLSCRP